MLGRVDHHLLPVLLGRRGLGGSRPPVAVDLRRVRKKGNNHKSISGLMQQERAQKYILRVLTITEGEQMGWVTLVGKQATN